MSFGLYVRNDDDYVQIDSDNPRLCALYSGTYSATSSSTVVVSFPAPIRTTEPPCIFIRNSPSQPDILYREMTITGSPGNWTGFRLESGTVTWRPTGKWFAAVFASRSAASWGLRMWDEAGVIIYDSGSTPIIFTKATNSWSYQGMVQLALGNAYYYLCAAVGALASDEYFMINPFSRGLMAPNQILTNWCGARFNYSINRLQIYSVGTTGWSDLGQPGAVFARLPGT